MTDEVYVRVCGLACFRIIRKTISPSTRASGLRKETGPFVCDMVEGRLAVTYLKAGSQVLALSCMYQVYSCLTSSNLCTYVHT